MIARIVKWWRGVQAERQRVREELEIVAELRRQGHFRPYTITVGGPRVVRPKSKKKSVPKYVEWRAVFRNGKPHRDLVLCPYCGGRARLGLKHPCKRAHKTFVIHKPGFYQSIAS